MNDEFSAEDFCTVIFDEFFFAGLARDNVPKHLLKLLWYIYPKLPTARLQTLVKALQPTSQVKMKEAWANVPCLTGRIKLLLLWQKFVGCWHGCLLHSFTKMVRPVNQPRVVSFL